jgi:hypothetical protein
MLIKVVNARLGKGEAKLFFNVAIGEEGANGPEFGLVIRDLVLRESRNGKGDYPSFPSKPRTKRATAVVDGKPTDVLVVQADPKDANKKVYDQIVDLYFDGEGTDRKVTDLGWKVRKQITDEATSVYQKLSGGQSGRGPAAAQAAAQVPAEFARTTGARSSASIFGNEESDDLPF